MSRMSADFGKTPEMLFVSPAFADASEHGGNQKKKTREERGNAKNLLVAFRNTPAETPLQAFFLPPPFAVPPITLSGGVLAASATGTLSNAVNVSAMSEVSIADSKQTLTLSGVVMGSGTLTKTGAGTLALTNAGTSVKVEEFRSLKGNYFSTL